MLQFVFGLLTGGIIGVVFMCLLQMNRAENQEDREILSERADFEKTVPGGVDNTTKKA